MSEYYCSYFLKEEALVANNQLLPEQWSDLDLVGVHTLSGQCEGAHYKAVTIARGGSPSPCPRGGRGGSSLRTGARRGTHHHMEGFAIHICTHRK